MIELNSYTKAHFDHLTLPNTSAPFHRSLSQPSIQDEQYYSKSPEINILPTILDTSNTIPSSTTNLTDLTGNVGTTIYIAPEVLSSHYDEKCDLYSLGIVLFEMTHSFTTGMERLLTMENLRKQITIRIRRIK
jgi:serine/threonine protein kinase